MDDHSNRDLSQVPDEALSPAERQELKRRLDDFVALLGTHFLGAPAAGSARDEDG